MDPYLLLAAAEGCAPGIVAPLLEPEADPDRLLVKPPPALPPSVRARLADRATLVRTASGWLDDASSLGLQVLTPGAASYPAALLRAPLRPLVLFARGAVEVLNAPVRRCLTIVGSRTPTAYGVAATEDFASVCARAGLVIWSGLALGVDGVAHECALAAGVPTVAVLAGGLAEVYPRAHADLARRILAGGGLWLTEAPPRLRATRGHFPRRNRILAAATQAVLVTEAGLASGSLHTAWFAAEAGREVFAVPGAYTSPRSRGCHQLISDGALLARDPEDLLRALDLTPATAGGGGDGAGDDGVDADQTAVMRVLEVGPRPEDLVWRESGLERRRFASALLALVHRQLVAFAPGGLLVKRYAR